jgi:uncharacterized spore protein YtfJ
MNEIEELLKVTLEEMEKVMSARTVVGDPITFEDKSLIPLVSIGMGFGAGMGTGKGTSTEKGGGAGGGIGIKPVAVIIIDKEGARVELLKHPPSSVIEKVAETIPKIAEGVPKMIEKHRGKKAEGEESSIEESKTSPGK